MERVTHRAIATARIGGVIGCVLAAISGCAPSDATTITPTPTRPLTAPMLVTTVTDGDTIHVRSAGDQAIVVRLSGIDAPETKDPRLPGPQCYGPEASAHLKQVLTGRTVQLEPGAEPVDKYGRTLAYLWLDKQLVNYQLVAAGYAREYTHNPKQPGPHADTLRIAQQQAQAADRGLWAPAGGNGRI